MAYTIKGKSSLNFTILKDDIPVLRGRSKWYSSSSRTVYDDNYIALSYSFFVKRNPIIKNGEVCGDIRWTMSGYKINILDRNGHIKKFKLKGKGLLNRKYHLIDDNETLIAIINPNIGMLRRKHNVEYYNEEYHEIDIPELLFYCMFIFRLIDRINS